MQFTAADSRYAQWVLRDLPSEPGERARTLDQFRRSEEPSVVRAIDWLVGDGDLRRYTPKHVRNVGGAGEVWTGADEEGNPVVIKKCPSHLPAHRLDQMRQVFGALKNHGHANIAPVLAHGFHTGESRYWVVMEDVGESTWADRIEREWQHRPDPAVLAGLMEQLALAIDHAHQACGVAHLDQKPSNVVFTSAGVPKIVDWDAALPLRPGESKRWRSGTPDYAAPEQVGTNGRVCQQTDIHGLGAILYATLAGGSAPYACGSEGVADWQTRTRREYPIRPEALTREAEPLWRIARWCFWKRPLNRFRSAAAVADQLAAVAAGQPTQVPERLPLFRRPLEHCWRRPDLVRWYTTAVVLPLVLLLSWMGVSAVSRAAAKQSRAEVVTRERDGRLNKLIETLNRGDYSPRTAEDSEGIARENPDDPVAQLSRFALHLRVARTDAERAAAVRQVGHPNANAQELRTLCEQLASLHRLVSLSISKYGGLDPLTDEKELNRLVGDLGKLSQNDATLAKAFNAVRPLRDLNRVGSTYSQDTELRMLSENRLAPPPHPFSHILGKVALYWRAERLAKDGADIPELLVHLGVARLSLGAFLICIPPPKGARQPVRADGAKTTPLDEVIRDQFVEAIRACRRARDRLDVSCTPAPPLEFMTCAVEAAATVYLLRTAPDLPPDVANGVGPTLTLLLQSQRNRASDHGSMTADNPSSDLLVRALLAGLLTAPRTEPEAALWRGRDKERDKRWEELRTHAGVLLMEWEKKEKKLAETAPDLGCPPELQNAILYGLAEMLPEGTRSPTCEAGDDVECFENAAGRGAEVDRQVERERDEVRARRSAAGGGANRFN